MVDLNCCAAACYRAPDARGGDGRAPSCLVKMICAFPHRLSFRPYLFNQISGSAVNATIFVACARRPMQETRKPWVPGKTPNLLTVWKKRGQPEVSSIQRERPGCLRQARRGGGRGAPLRRPLRRPPRPAAFALKAAACRIRRSRHPAQRLQAAALAWKGPTTYRRISQAAGKLYA